MAEVAVAGSMPSSSMPFERGAAKVRAGTKRKTPSELREDQLRRNICAASTVESSSSLLVSKKDIRGFRCVKKPETSKIPRNVDVRVDEVFPVKKCSDMFRMSHGKEKVKERLPCESSISSNNSFPAPSLANENWPQHLCADGSAVSAPSNKDSMAQSCKMAEKHGQGTFLSVAELSLGHERSSGQPALDMEALKRLGACEPPANFHSSVVSSERFGDVSQAYFGNSSIELDLPDSLTPLDLTLKTKMRLVSSSSVKWCHRLTTSAMAQFMSPIGFPLNKEASPSLGPKSSTATLFSRSLHSWVFPQSSLPPSVISALNLSAAQGETDFLFKRQVAWEDSFRSLYYMLRKNACDIFYVSTSKFVVMFVGSDQLGKTKRPCCGYISQSTRGLRSLLREHDICFSMPLCNSEAEQATAEDLVELSEIEKRNLGHVRRLGSTSEIDNTQQSLLAFSGNDSVHGLYDFLLNYRSFFTSLTGADVPVIYSPIPFQNASLSVPEVKCREIKSLDAFQVLSRGPNSEDFESNKDRSAGLSYVIEIKGTALPPWIISGVCASMVSEKQSFEARFTTEPNSVGLNVALDVISQNSDAEAEPSKENAYTFGIPGCVVSPRLRSAALRGLKYCNDSYTASASPL
ncbi:hypothetical protein Sjap_021621 [Stephania japonica]|uniref:Protein downstream neighbor of Son n=1 Tax=Stephania japonica TaxID=461633 RepID=A0AAP0EMQ4_9MAGN